MGGIAMSKMKDGSSSEKQREETMYIPGDIIEQIVIRLPVKSIIRFRLVSKFWYTVIADSSFVQTHLNFVSKNHSLDLVKFSLLNEISVDENGVFKYKLWTPLPLKYLKSGLVGSCNGLVCMHVNEKILVFNPATRESISLPNSSIGKSYTSSFFWEGGWNFGFDPYTNEYKIIHFYEEDIPHQIQCKVEVFTLGKDMDSWREIKGGAPMMPFNHAISIGATMYWKLQDSVNISILFFDLSEEKFGQIEAPCEECFESLPMNLDGRLCWVSINLQGEKRVMKLWALDEEPGKDKFNWTLFYTIQLPFVKCTLKYIYRNKMHIVEYGATTAHCYSLVLIMKNNSVKYELYDHNDDMRDCLTSSCAYVESLLSLP